MGSIFELIADDALQRQDDDYFTACQCCDEKNVPLYCSPGCLIEDGVVNEDKDIFVACEKCIKAQKIERADEYYLNDFIRRHCDNANRIIALFRSTPRPSIYSQDTDWPFCCGKPAEFIGSPCDTRPEEFFKNGNYWHFDPEVADNPLFESIDPSESGMLFGGFECTNCKTLWYTFSAT